MKRHSAARCSSWRSEGDKPADVTDALAYQPVRDIDVFTTNAALGGATGAGYPFQGVSCPKG